MHSNIRKLSVSQTVIALTLLLGLSACADDDHPNLTTSHGLVQMGDQLRGRGDDMAAADFYQRALQTDPENNNARENLGEILEAHGDINSAEMEYRTALSNDPENANLLRAHGRVLIKQGRAGDARHEYERVLGNNADDVKALNGLGIAEDYLGQHDEAQQSYRSALDNEPNDLATLNNLAHSYVLSGKYDEAIKLLEPHATDKNATPALRQNLAEAYGLSGMEADAERMARMDLPPAQVKHNLDYYKSQRIKLALVPKFYADLGAFPTQEMAEARAEEIKARYPIETSGRLVKAAPTVGAIGKTPTFTVHVVGFDKLDQLRVFCDKLKKDGLICKVQTAL